MKRILKVLLVVIPLTLVCYYPGSFVWSLFDMVVLKPAEMEGAIRPYGGATALFKDWDHILTNTDQATWYYWSADSMEKVKASYEDTGLVFLPGTPQNDWFITAYNKSGSWQELPFSADGVNNHQTICTVPWRFNWNYLTDDAAENARLETEKAKEFGCISITLVETNHPNLCMLPVVFPANRVGPYLADAPYENCARFPEQGTLIIFNYYLEGM